MAFGRQGGEEAPGGPRSHRGRFWPAERGAEAPETPFTYASRSYAYTVHRRGRGGAAAAAPTRGRRGRRRTPQRARRDERPAMLGAGPVHSARCGRGGRRRYEDCQGRGRKRRPFVQAGQEAVSPGGASDGGPPRPVSRRSHTARPQSAPAARGAAGMYFRAGGAAPPWRTRQSEECSWPWTGRPTPTGPSTWRCEWPRRRPQPWPGSSR